MKFKGLNDNKITVDAGISNGLIGKGRKRGGISQENISKILFTYPEINANWLLTGKGEMLKEETHPVPVMDKNALEMIKELSAENAILKKENEELKREKKVKASPLAVFDAK